MQKFISVKIFLPEHFILLLLIAFISFLHLKILHCGVDAGLHIYGAYLIDRGLLPYEHLWNNKPPLIYLIGSAGFILKSNPMSGIRMIEVIIFYVNLVLIYKIIRLVKLSNPVIYLLCYCAIYLLCWDSGFLTETFTVPMNLMAIYFFLRKSRGFEFISAFFLILSFMLKQNAICIIGALILIDVFTSFRKPGKLNKIAFYLAGFPVYLISSFLILKKPGLYEEFMDQVFTYNYYYAEHTGLYRALVNHLWHNSFISIKGVSVLMIFNICVLVSLWSYWKKYQLKQSISFQDQFILISIIVYLISYPFVYLSAKTYPHYFILLLVPATFIFGNYVKKTIAGKLALGVLLTAGIIINARIINSYTQNGNQFDGAANFIREHSTKSDYILVAGFGNQYLHVLADRLSPTKFIMPLKESNGYTAHYRKIILEDLQTKPPLFIILNKNNYRNLNQDDFYTRTISEKLQSYALVFENEKFEIFKLLNSRETRK